LTIRPNTKVAIVGDSGAGKSTLFQLITRFYDPDQGSVYVDDQDLAECDPRSIRSHLAMVRQDSDLFTMTYLENILYGTQDPLDSHTQLKVESILEGLKTGQLSREDRDVVEQIMNSIRDANANDYIKSSKDLVNLIGEGGKGLSGGQKQRMTIARALFKNPKILLLDEVTSALDQISESIIQKALDKLTKNRTVLIVAHRLHTIKNSDVIIVMEQGQIFAQGTHKELMKSCPKYKTMVKAAKETSKKKNNTKTAKILSLMKEIAEEAKNNNKSSNAKQITKLLAPIISSS